MQSQYYSNLSSIYDRWIGHIGPLGPSDTFSAYNIQKYAYRTGPSAIDPCLVGFGKVIGVDCKTINPHFMYSGNPATNLGWIIDFTADHSVIISSGPFQLEENKPIDIWVCYSSIKDDSLSGAYSKMLELDRYAQTFYDFNFFIEPPTPQENNRDPNNYDFYLWNNYPNPFNSTTKIRYNLDRTETTSLIVYNILGEKVVKLVDQVQDAGVYEVDFNAQNLPSGIYYYQLRQNAFFDTRKMLYLK